MKTVGVLAVLGMAVWVDRTGGMVQLAAALIGFTGFAIWSVFTQRTI